MSSVNKVILVGNLGRDPEVKATTGGTSVCNISIATSSSWKDKTTGERMEETEWHRVVMYGALAEIAGKYLTKGKSVYIEGQIKTRKWQDKEGNDKQTTEIVANEMRMLGLQGLLKAILAPPAKQEKESAPKTAKQRAIEVMEDDIPF